MPSISFVDPQVGLPDSTQEPLIPIALDTIKNAINGNLGASNLLPAFLSSLFILQPAPGSGQVWKVDFGLALVGGPAGSGSSAPYSTLTTVNHNLGVMPQYIFATAASGSAQIGVPGVIAPYPYASATGSPTTTHFSLQGKVIPGGFETTQTWGQTGLNPLPVFWLAIGPAPAPTS